MKNNELNEEMLKEVSGGAGGAYGWFCPFCGSLITTNRVEYTTGDLYDRPFDEKPVCDCGCKIFVKYNIGLMANKSCMNKKCDYHSID